MAITNKEKNFVSAVVYLCNEEKNVENFLKVINETLSNNFEKYEIICVNDCSDDNTEKAVENFCENNKTKSLTLIKTSFFQGLENAMVAGVDMAIGDFVFEFDSCNIDYTDSLIMGIYYKSLSGNDIVFACNTASQKYSSSLFYSVFNRFSGMKYKLKTQSFSIISRRGINRVKSMGVKTVYRKAIYASCGLNVDEIIYKPTNTVRNNNHQAKIRKDLAINSLILFTDIGYKISLILSALMASVVAFSGLYTVMIYLAAKPTEGWTTMMLLASFGFLGIFIILAIITKYLSLILNLIFSKKEYVIEAVRKITK